MGITHYLVTGWFVFVGAFCPNRALSQTRMDSYQTKGVVKVAPHQMGEFYMVNIQHEDLPDFKDKEGKVVGMHAMTMGFLTKDPKLVAGIHGGDKVQFEFEAQWQVTPRFILKSIQKIPN